MLRHTRIGSLPDLSAVEQWSRMFERHPKIKVGCRNLAQNPREFGKSMDWLLTGEDGPSSQFQLLATLPTPFLSGRFSRCARSTIDS